MKRAMAHYMLTVQSNAAAGMDNDNIVWIHPTLDSLLALPSSFPYTFLQSILEGWGGGKFPV